MLSSRRETILFPSFFLLVPTVCHSSISGGYSEITLPYFEITLPYWRITLPYSTILLEYSEIVRKKIKIVQEKSKIVSEFTKSSQFFILCVPPFQYFCPKIVKKVWFWIRFRVENAQISIFAATLLPPIFPLNRAFDAIWWQGGSKN